MNDKEMNELNQLFTMFSHVDQDLVKDIYFGTEKKFEDALNILIVDFAQQDDNPYEFHDQEN